MRGNTGDEAPKPAAPSPPRESSFRQYHNHLIRTSTARSLYIYPSDLLPSRFNTTISFPVKISLPTRNRKLMATAGKASMVVAASVAAVEALKDQAGLCRWNYALRSLHQRAKSGGGGVGVSGGAKRASSSALDKWRRGGKGAAERTKRTEESLAKVMYWESWGPK